MLHHHHEHGGQITLLAEQQRAIDARSEGIEQLWPALEGAPHEAIHVLEHAQIPDHASIHESAYTLATPDIDAVSAAT